MPWHLVLEAELCGADGPLKRGICWGRGGGKGFVTSWVSEQSSCWKHGDAQGRNPKHPRPLLRPLHRQLLSLLWQLQVKESWNSHLHLQWLRPLGQHLPRRKPKACLSGAVGGGVACRVWSEIGDLFHPSLEHSQDGVWSYLKLLCLTISCLLFPNCLLVMYSYNPKVRLKVRIRVIASTSSPYPP